jgi:hypothetical protein
MRIPSPRDAVRGPYTAANQERQRGSGREPYFPMISSPSEHSCWRAHVSNRAAGEPPTTTLVVPTLPATPTTPAPTTPAPASTGDAGAVVGLGLHRRTTSRLCSQRLSRGYEASNRKAARTPHMRTGAWSAARCGHWARPGTASPQALWPPLAQRARFPATATPVESSRALPPHRP